MRKEAKQKVVIIGCGNLAWNIASHLSALKKFDLHVSNHRTNERLSLFKNKLKCTVSFELAKMDQDGDVFIICVSDRSISSVSKKIKPLKPNALILHTSGGEDLNQIKTLNGSKGVLYPLQTFSFNTNVDWKRIPLLIEAENSKVLSSLKKFATHFGERILELSSEKRAMIHVCAVLVNNFTNALFVSANTYIKKSVKGQDIKLLLPLIEQTVTKIKHNDPIQMQTGPAKRNDTAVISKHLKLLSGDKQLQLVYKDLSNLIKLQNEHS